MVSPAFPAEQKRYTREDLFALYELPENAHKKLELVDGVIYEMAPPSPLHQRVIVLLNRILTAFLLQHDIGLLYLDNTGYDLPDGGMVMPDLSFVLYNRVLPANVRMDFAPDLAIEVISPSNTENEIRGKVRSYLNSGGKRVWIIYPDTQEIDVYVLQDDGKIAYKTHGVNDMLDGEDVLPGFSVPVSDIFPK